MIGHPDAQPERPDVAEERAERHTIRKQDREVVEAERPERADRTRALSFVKPDQRLVVSLRPKRGTRIIAREHAQTEHLSVSTPATAGGC